MRLPKLKMSARKFHVTLMHVALLMFFCDLVAAVFPSFDHWWQSREHFLVALAATLESVSGHIWVWLDEREGR